MENARFERSGRPALAACAVWLLFSAAAHSEKPVRGVAPDDKALFETICGSCHPVALAAGLRSEPEWKETMDAMVRHGMKATDEEFTRVLRYLVRTQTKVNVNTATAQQIAPVLDISEASAEALVESRRKKGAFKGIEDLKNVPGVEPARVEARKDRIVFR